MKRIDLHVHSTASDGTFTPSELVSYALKKGLTAMALTDHDTVSGVKEAAAAQILSIFFTIALLYQLSSSSASFW